MDVAAGTMADFTGVLIRRQYKPGQSYVQLVFKTAEGIQLSLSRNVRFVRSLHVGHTYRVKGKAYSVGDKTYINDPVAMPIRVQQSYAKRHKRLLIASSIIILAIGIAAAVSFMSQDSTSANQGTTPKTTVARPITETPLPAAPQEVAPAPTSAPAATSTPVSTKKATVKKTAPATATTTTAPPAPATSNPAPATDDPTPAADPAPIEEDSAVVVPPVEEQIPPTPDEL